MPENMQNKAERNRDTDEGSKKSAGCGTGMAADSVMLQYFLGITTKERNSKTR